MSDESGFINRQTGEKIVVNPSQIPSCLGAPRQFFEIGEHRFNITDNPCREKILQMLVEVLKDTMQVFDFGARKHPDSGDTPNFLTPEGNKCSLTVRGNSCLHHSSDVRANVRADHESGLHPALHLIASAAILYIRQKRNIVSPEDEGQ